MRASVGPFFPLQNGSDTATKVRSHSPLTKLVSIISYIKLTPDSAAVYWLVLVSSYIYDIVTSTDTVLRDVIYSSVMQSENYDCDFRNSVRVHT